MKIIFDFDGTIHKSDEIYEKAFYDTLKKYKIKKTNYNFIIGLCSFKFNKHNIKEPAIAGSCFLFI